MFALGWLLIHCYRNSGHTEFLGIAFDDASDQKWYSFDKLAQMSSSNHSGRPVFPYSVIKGGVQNVDELRKAIAKDKIVAAHYSDFNLHSAQVVQLKTAKAAYVSYRISNNVFWTKRKIRVAKGEKLITDGKNYLRTRCGNRISEVEHATTSPNEPTQEVLDTPIVTGGKPTQMAFEPKSGIVGLVPNYLLLPSGNVLGGGPGIPPVHPQGPGGSLVLPPVIGGGFFPPPPNRPPGTPPRTPGGSVPPQPPANGGNPPPSNPPTAPPTPPGGNGNTPTGSGPPNTPPPSSQPSPPTPPVLVEITPPPTIIVETPPPVIIPPPPTTNGDNSPPPAPVPEPSTLLLLSSGLGSYLIYRRKSKNVR